MSCRHHSVDMSQCDLRTKFPPILPLGWARSYRRPWMSSSATGLGQAALKGSQKEEDGVPAGGRFLGQAPCTPVCSGPMYGPPLYGCCCSSRCSCCAETAALSAFPLSSFCRGSRRTCSCARYSRTYRPGMLLELFHEEYSEALPGLTIDPLLRLSSLTFVRKLLNI